MNRIVMLNSASQDLRDIVAYISQFSKKSALDQYDQIITKIDRLKDFPELYGLYKPGRFDMPYRKLVAGDYLVFYVVNEDEIQIIRILHGSRDIAKFLPK